VGHRRDEAIPAPCERFDELRRLGRISKRLSHFLNCGIETVLEVDERVVLPQSLAELLARGHLATPFQQRGEDLARLILHPDTLAIAIELSRGGVELEGAETEARG
jgi:hypothetical protein